MYTWQVINTSTMLPVIEADPASTLSQDEAVREACEWLIAEADGLVDDDEGATLLDAAAQDLNVSHHAVTVDGAFSWEVSILPTSTVEG